MLREKTCLNPEGSKRGLDNFVPCCVRNWTRFFFQLPCHEGVDPVFKDQLYQEDIVLVAFSAADFTQTNRPLGMLVVAQLHDINSIDTCTTLVRPYMSFVEVLLYHSFSLKLNDRL